MLRLAFVLALWLLPATALCQENVITVTTATGGAARVPTLLYFQQLRMACQALVTVEDDLAECQGKVAYMRITASNINRRMREAEAYRFLEWYDDLAYAWREVMDENIKLSAATRMLLEKFPQVSRFVAKQSVRDS